jgi:phosphoribosylformimino-5-aminoimidazole carboxamide ribotide isomerase
VIVIPAIDLKDGRCVRLQQGRMSKEVVYSEDPRETALKWYQEGAERLHLVDLNGAVEGRPFNQEAIKKIVEAVPIPVQLGGGIRDIETIETYLGLGIDQIILGTAAYKDPGLIATACERFPDRIILGIDAREGLVSIEGWTEDTNISASDMARKYGHLGISAIVYTDIQRDGMGTGPNIEATRNLAEAIDIPVIASGGISGIDDVKNLLSLKKYGVTGMITGKALYEGTLSLADAIGVVEQMVIQQAPKK